MVQGTGRESKARAICQNFPSVSVCQGRVGGRGGVCLWGHVWGRGPGVLVLSSGWKFSVSPGSYQKPLEGIHHLTHKNRSLEWRMPKMVLQFPNSNGPICSLPSSIKGTHPSHRQRQPKLTLLLQLSPRGSHCVVQGLATCTGTVTR